MSKSNNIVCPSCGTCFTKEVVDSKKNLEITCIYCQQAITKENNINKSKTKNTKSKTNYFIFNILILIAVLISLIITGSWHYRDKLAENKKFNPYITKFCQILNCHLKSYSDISKIIIKNPKISSDQNNSLAMILTANMTNNANLAQPYPKLKLNFMNQEGELVYKQEYNPEQYLKSKANTKVISKNQNSDIEIKLLANDKLDVADISLVILENQNS